MLMMKLFESLVIWFPLTAGAGVCTSFYLITDQSDDCRVICNLESAAVGL